MPRKTTKPVVGEAVSLADLKEFQATALASPKGNDPLEEILKDTPQQEPKDVPQMNGDNEYVAVEEVDNGFVDEPGVQEDPKPTIPVPCAESECCCQPAPSLADKLLNNENVDWEGLIPQEYFLVTEGGQRLVKVQGLYDLLHKVGFSELRSEVAFASPTMVIVKASLVIENNLDSREIVALAEGTPANCGEPPFDSFLAAIADTRAKGRAIRQMFNIRATVEEELDPKSRKQLKKRAQEPAPTPAATPEKPAEKPAEKPKSNGGLGRATQKQVGFIHMLLKNNHLELDEFAQRHPELALPEAPDEETDPLTMLSVQQANILIKFLTDPNSKK